jgi:DNA-binding transcriptional ArsR family regulator
VTEVTTRITDPQVMRALAHPARSAILEAMYSGRSGTATEFAEVCGLSPSATSYHLRVLAKAGLVDEAPGRGDGRERVWRSVSSGSYEVIGGPHATDEVRQAERDMIHVFLARQDERARAWASRIRDEPQEWYDATMLTESVLLLTPDELAQINAKVIELLRPYRRAERDTEAPEGARRVGVSYRALPL